MTPSRFAEIIKCCEENDVLFISTPYSIEDADFLDQLGAPAFKRASIHAAEPWFARYVASKGKPLILSTGMVTLSELDSSVRAIKETEHQLGKLSDYDLADIGLTRGDIYTVARANETINNVKANNNLRGWV